MSYIYRKRTDITYRKEFSVYALISGENVMAIVALYILLYTIVTIAIIIGNSCLFATIIKCSHINTPFHIFLVNVAVSDLLFLFLSTRHAVDFMFKRWPL